MSRRYVSSAYMNFGLSNSSGCPVCGDSGARHNIVMQILAMLRTQGRFGVTGMKEFWQLFSGDLCFICQNELNSIEDNKRQAKQLLEEAAQLDPGNKPIKENLAFVKKII